MGGVISFSDNCDWFPRTSIFRDLCEVITPELAASEVEARHKLERAIIGQGLYFEKLWVDAPAVARRLLPLVYAVAERLAGDEGAEDSQLQSSAEKLAELFRSGRVQQTLPPEHADLIPILEALKPKEPPSKGGMIYFTSTCAWLVRGKVATKLLQAILDELPEADTTTRAALEEGIRLEGLAFDYLWENAPEAGRRLLPLVYQMAWRLAGPEGADDPYSQERYARLAAMFRSGEVQRTLPPEHADLKAALPLPPADASKS